MADDTRLAKVLVVSAGMDADLITFAAALRHCLRVIETELPTAGAHIEYRLREVISDLDDVGDGLRYVVSELAAILMQEEGDECLM